ncbi:MAG: dipeptidase [Planctomycetes bacterium]|nr:dipeptidase [Planctomycetota bacterium]
MIEKVIAYIDAQRETYVSRLNELLRIPSISTDPERRADTRRAGQWVHQLLLACGMKSEMLDTAGHPCIIADSGAGDGPAVLIYGHYDVQPTGDESLWHSPPFEPTVRNGSVFARGSADDKGQVLAHLLAAEAWMKVAGKLPTRVKFLIEGEEEIGSPNLERIVQSQGERLACGYVALSDTPKFNADIPAITYGTKGLIYKEIIVTGPKQNLHSGSYGGTLTNPGNAAAQIIARMHDADRRVTVPGFYDDVRELTAEEKAQMKRLPFDEQGYLSAMGAPALTGERGFTTLERRWARPTLDVNGIVGGFIGAGASTVIPAKMVVKVSMRLVPNQKHEKVSRAFDEYVRSLAPEGVTIELLNHSHCSAYVSPLGTPGMKAAEAAIEAGFGKKPFYIREGGTLPILPLFKSALGAESLMIGFCHPDCNAHGPNEFFGLSDFHCGIKTAAHFMHRMSQAA